MGGVDESGRQLVRRTSLPLVDDEAPEAKRPRLPVLDGDADRQQEGRLSPPASGQPRDDGATPQRQGPGAASPWAKEELPPPLENEIEFLIRDPRSYAQGRSVLSPIRAMQGSFRFRLLVFPAGTESTQKPEQLAAFVEAVPPDSYKDTRWAFEGVKYQISVVNWRDYRRTVTQQDTFNFQRGSADRGWHRNFLKVSDMTTESGWLGPNGELCLRASCSARRAMLQMSDGLAGSSRRLTGYVGLKNHGATCYMNCLLQTLFHIGRFRHIVYSIDSQEPVEQACLSGDEALDACGDRPAQPLLIALQNLFYRLQTSEAPVSCRELMRSFGWDTVDAFMQHDAQELNRLLCDRLEEQMKGTPMDGAIKRLFEGEVESYIECVDVDYRSQRTETFYDLQLNVKNEAGKELVTLEEALRDFTSEETLEGDNAYDAGSHGKQRARKGCRFKRFPPVLYIQLKRFMFDVERMDMCKLNGRLEFPIRLDLEALAGGSGSYALHSVVVHSGSVSSGHYYAFARLREGRADTGCRWAKFDDEVVTICSEHEAVVDNYGGEDPMIWDYFKLAPDQLSGRGAPTMPRIHNAYMLSYVREDFLEEVMAPPLLDHEEKKYQRMVDRCTREARQAEERRKARMELLAKVEVRLLLERDLCKLEGFWAHGDLPCFKRLQLSRDQPGDDLYHEVQELLGIDFMQIALFTPHYRKTKQMRFKFLEPRHFLRQSLPAPAANASELPRLVVLCVASKGYDPFTLKWVPSLSTSDGPHEIYRWTDVICLLVVKYFCPSTQRLITLGCHYCHNQDKIESMVSEGWLHERLQPSVDRKEVAPLETNAEMMCWEEFCHKNPKDIIERNISATIEKEGLYCGDIIVWQPVPAALITQPSPGSPGAGPGNTAVQGSQPEDPDDLEDVDCPARTVRELAAKLTSQVQMLVRLHSPEAPWRPEGLAADGAWGTSAAPAEDAQEGALHGCETAAAPALPGEVDSRELAADTRWRISSLSSRVVKAFELHEAIKGGQSLWLFDRGSPSSVPDAPAFRVEATPLIAGSGDRHLSELYPRTYAVARQRWTIHGVVLPRPPSTPVPRGPGGWRPVAVHFFDASVREVGAVILHVPEVEAEEASRSPELPTWTAGDDDAESESGADANAITGRPAVDPAEVLEMARQHLRASRELCAKMLPASSSLPPGGDVAELPALRLLDVVRGRLRAVHRHSGHDPHEQGGGTREADEPAVRASRLWPARGSNFLVAALRVELDIDTDVEQASEDGADGGTPATQLVEVFHAEHSGHSFGHPFLLHVNDNERVSLILARLQVKLNVPDAELRAWRLLLTEGSPRDELPRRTSLEAADRWPARRSPPPGGGRASWHAGDVALCVERLHPVHGARSPQGAHRTLRAKPLTIRAR